MVGDAQHEEIVVHQREGYADEHAATPHEGYGVGVVVRVEAVPLSHLKSGQRPEAAIEHP